MIKRANDFHTKAAAAAAATTVELTGYLVDLYCWDKPNHMAIDGANLGTEPEKHTVHCLRDVQACIDGGYALLEKKAGSASYSLKYKLDATGNANIILRLIKTTPSIANFQVTATGTASADGLTLNGATFVEYTSSSPPPAKTPSGNGGRTFVDFYNGAGGAGGTGLMHALTPEPVDLRTGWPSDCAEGKGWRKAITDFTGDTTSKAFFDAFELALRPDGAAGDVVSEAVMLSWLEADDVYQKQTLVGATFATRGSQNACAAKTAADKAASDKVAEAKAVADKAKSEN